MFSWNDKYCINVPIIDEQHKEIFKICRKLELLLECPTTVYILNDTIEILSDLRNYITFHFYTEENYMKSINYPNFLSHKKEHDNFKDLVISLDIDTLINSKIDLQILLNNLYSFLLNHVLESDMKLNFDF